MIVTLKQTDGKREKVEFRDDMFIEIEDILPDGSEVIDLIYPDDMFASDIY